ncbi:DUF1212-domain-containing protein [Aureobasidium subglaciale]|nr:DUF1212-domain-containing protein [Aureobasidium subglaciale]
MPSTSGVAIEKPTELSKITSVNSNKNRYASSNVVFSSGTSTPIRRIPHDSNTSLPQSLLPTVLQDTADPGTTGEREKYLLTVCRALMAYGAPTHRLEEYMYMTAEVIGLRVESFYLPGIMVVSFNNTIWRSTEVHIVKTPQALNLAKLYDSHEVYKNVIHDRMTIEEATHRLDEIMTSTDKYPRWLCVIMFGLASACIGPVSYGARPVDLPIIFLFGCLLGFMQLVMAENSELYAHVYEVSAAILMTFLSRAIGSINYGSGRLFCFSAISQASLVLILPGFIITNSALELQSKNIISGAVRMVYGIIFVMFLAFGFTVGITLYGAMDENATSATTCEAQWPFWWKVTFVIPFTFCYIIINQGKWKKVPAMLVLSMIGWLVNYYAAQGISRGAHVSKGFGSSIQLAQMLGALAIGLVANFYSRLGQGLAVALLHPAIFIQVPGSFAASGSLINAVANADLLTKHNSGSDSLGTVQDNSSLTNAALAMVEIAIGITVGISISALLVYPIRKKRRSGLFSF